MVKISIMYPHAPDARFDHDYYRDQHMPMVKRLLGDACLYYTVDKGVSGVAPGSAPVYVGMCHIFSPSAEAFAAAMGPHAKEIQGDIRNYTDLRPVMQISDVVVEHS
jgi:uncharacterized protein (TIGR02118 family)